jgi:hypothetical protein
VVLVVAVGVLMRVVIKTVLQELLDKETQVVAEVLAVILHKQAVVVVLPAQVVVPVEVEQVLAHSLLGQAQLEQVQAVLMPAVAVEQGLEE